MASGHSLPILYHSRGRRWWVWGIVHGRCVVVVGAGLLFVGTGLPIVGGGARSREQVVCVCWFVVRGHGGDMSSALWSSLATLEGTRVGVLTMDVSIINDERRHRHRSSCGCRGLRGHRLASADGREGVTHHKEQRRMMTSLSFVIWLPHRSQRCGTCTPPHPSPSVVMWQWSFAVVVVFGVWMVGDGQRWATMDDDGGGGSERRVFGKQTHSRTNTRVTQMGG